jgi:hypothetical protein
MLMMQSRQGGATKTIPGYTYQRCQEAAESVDQSAIKAGCVPDPGEPTQQEVEQRQAEANRQAAALRDAVIDPSDLTVEKMTIGAVVGGGAEFASGYKVPYKVMESIPAFSAVITNHSSKTLRTFELKIEIKDCPNCRAIHTTSWKHDASIPRAVNKP